MRGRQASNAARQPRRASSILTDAHVQAGKAGYRGVGCFSLWLQAAERPNSAPSARTTADEDDAEARVRCNELFGSAPDVSSQRA
jgi:hypothetical protein